jgi:asparagine synthase (glutamine-hydrolysing)
MNAANPAPRALSPLEVATSLLFGFCERAEENGNGHLDPRAELEALIRPALMRAPCVVGFSGGRDSSALLACALALARREGWPEPVPVTLDFGTARTDEREWQELVVAHVRPRDWVRVAVRDELDLVGPLAAPGLRRHGLLFPANAHLIVPLAREAREGSVLTGVGGDDTFGRWTWHDLGSVAAGRRPARPGDVRRLAHALAPQWLRAEVLRRRAPLTLSWLRPEIKRAVTRRVALELSSAPLTWSARMRWSARWRSWQVAAQSIALLGADHGAAVHSPFLHPSYLGALARAGGRWGWGDRTDTMRALFADLLPEALIARATKAEFGEPLFGEHTRRFALQWDGRSGLEGLVEAEVIRRVWTAPQPHALSAIALQAAWLASGAPEPNGNAAKPASDGTEHASEGIVAVGSR